MSQEACDCFSKQKGDIDARMAPCIENVSYSQTVNLPEGYSLQDSVLAVGKIKSKMDSINAKKVADLSTMTRYMAVSCDAFGSELEILYDKWYPIDSSAANLDSIKSLDSKFRMLAVSDTAKKTVLHKLISKNIEARRLEEGLRRCQQMKQLFKNEGGAYYASAFIYNLQKKYPEAISELKQEISISGDKNLELIVAVIKRKAQRNK
ncbi:hypothetical protein GCM10027044_25450 [Hymenobacter ruber]